MGKELGDGWSHSESRARFRHGRSHRSVLSGKNLTPIMTRKLSFDRIIGDTVDYLRHSLGEELSDTSFEIASLPDRGTLTHKISAGEQPLWFTDREAQRVVLYRLPIERLSRRRGGNAFEKQLLMESAVFRAVSELLGRELWNFGES